MNIITIAGLFVSGLADSVIEEQLEQLFLEYKISFITIPKDVLTKKNFGYGFIGFKKLAEGKSKFINTFFSLL